MISSSCISRASAKNSFARSRLWAESALLLFAISSPVFLRAQFQQPTQEELKMTSDPKAPGASAVYLFHEEITDDQDHSFVLYDRIKVLTEKGKELAIISVPYEHGIDKVAQIEGRTIHADGTVVPLTAKPSDLTEIKTKGFQENVVTFTLPGVEVGSILEYRVKLERNDDWDYLPGWQIQKPYFIHKAHYSFRPDPYRTIMYTGYFGSDSPKVQEKKGFIFLDITDVPPEPDEDWMPPMNTLRWRVQFFSNPGALSVDAFWDNAREYWTTWIENFIKPSKTITKAVAGIVAHADTDEQKAVKIYDAVQKLDNTDFSREKSKAERKKEKLNDLRTAEDFWKQQRGSSNDIALLYASMARAAGLKAWPAFIVNRDRAIFDKSYLSDSQFDDDVVMVELDGKDVYLDPGEKMCPFGSLHRKHTWATGYLLTEKRAIFATTPGLTYTNSTVRRNASLDIDKAGNLKGVVSVAMAGPTALYWRQLALENSDEEVQKQFTDSIDAVLPEDVQARFGHVLGLQDYNSVLVATFTVSGNIGSATGKYFFLPGFFFETRAQHPFIAESKRTIPIDVHFPETDIDQATYNLPPGLKLVSAPQNADTAWPGYALFKIRSSAGKNSVTVARALAYNFTLLDPKEYPSLHDFYLKVASADQQQLVLAHVTASKGN